MSKRHAAGGLWLNAGRSGLIVAGYCNRFLCCCSVEAQFAYSAVTGETLQNLGGKQSDVRFTPAANMVFQTAKLDSPNIGEPQPELKEVRSLGFRVSLSCAAATDLQSAPCIAAPRRMLACVLMCEQSASTEAVHLILPPAGQHGQRFLPDPRGAFFPLLLATFQYHH